MKNLLTQRVAQGLFLFATVGMVACTDEVDEMNAVEPAKGKL